MATGNWNNTYYYDSGTAATSPNYFTTTTNTGGNQTWYYYDSNGEAVRSDSMPSHSHSLPASGGSWRDDPKDQDALYVKGEKVVKYNGDLEFKQNGKWVSLSEITSRIDVMEVLVERMYNMLSPWQKKKLESDRQELKEEQELDYIDPDLFKV